MSQEQTICIVGGAGHVGLPLALAFADARQRVIVYDTDTEALDVIRGGTMPFVEYGAEPLLARALAAHRLVLTADPRDITSASHVIVAVGTPVDEYLNPKLRALLDLFRSLRPHLRPSQTIIIRSTVFPRTCRQVERASLRQRCDLAETRVGILAWPSSRISTIRATRSLMSWARFSEYSFA